MIVAWRSQRGVFLAGSACGERPAIPAESVCVVVADTGGPGITARAPFTPRMSKMPAPPADDQPLQASPIELVVKSE